MPNKALLLCHTIRDATITFIATRNTIDVTNLMNEEDLAHLIAEITEMEGAEIGIKTITIKNDEGDTKAMVKLPF